MLNVVFFVCLLYSKSFYGACNEAVMRLSLVKNGPMVVAFEVYNDFYKYAGGIYHHTGLTDKQNFGFNPFELTNHAGKRSLFY